MTATHPYGIDIAVNTGELVHAVRDGRVIFAGGDACCSYGYYVILEHDDGWTSLYAHLSAFGVAWGDHVLQGEVIGLSGETGKARGAHLHFELRSWGAPVNPISYLGPR
jgi:murein DD-endopeptidase MepM/ murein hydrolase activator NlpD